MKIFVIDVSRCVGCHSCQIACKDEHCGNDWTPFAKPQPDTGQFWMKVNEHIRGTIPKVKVAYVPVLCQHCIDAPCQSVCPESAIYKRDDGLVIIDPAKCTGCKDCMDACPYNVIYFNEELNIAQKCTGCAHLLEKGWTVPRCVDNCPSEAIQFGEESEFDLSNTETLYPEYNLKTRVFYRNLPKRFIAGTVYDPIAEDVVVGATCTLSGDSSVVISTNGFGDFWFEGLPVGNYSLKINTDSKTLTITDINTEKDVNLGDIPIS